jgi:small subunit ribosomal protein S4
MSRYRGPRLRLVRRLGELPGLSRKITNRQNPPGQHGKTKKKKKPSQYSIRLQEKQKLRFNYGITELQLISYIRKAKTIKGSTGEVLLQLLEMRLDNVLFCLGITPTIAAARQLINHGHILINSKKVTIPSYQCKLKDEISISEKKKSRDLVKNFIENSNVNIIPQHLTFNKEKLIGIVTNMVNRQSISLKIKELLVVEYYSRKV